MSGDDHQPDGVSGGTSDGVSGGTSDGVSGGEPAERSDDGLELARLIARSLAGAASRPASPGERRAPGERRSPGMSGGRRRAPGPAVSSGAHPDERDPQLLTSSLGRLVSDRGWRTDLQVHGLFARWPELVGSEVAAHCTPESFKDGRLGVRTDSTAWSTQLTLLAADVVRRLNQELGHGTVTFLDVSGPLRPSWRKGRLRVPGRGPRDTYG